MGSSQVWSWPLSVSRCRNSTTKMRLAAGRRCRPRAALSSCRSRDRSSPTGSQTRTEPTHRRNSAAGTANRCRRQVRRARWTPDGRQRRSRPSLRLKSERGQMLKARQRAVHQRIQIAFDKSETRAAGKTDKGEIGDAQPAQFTREKGEHDDRQRLCQFLDRRTEKPRDRPSGIDSDRGKRVFAGAATRAAARRWRHSRTPSGSCRGAASRGRQSPGIPGK